MIYVQVGLLGCIIYRVKFELDIYILVDSMCMGSSHVDMVLLGVQSLMLPALIRLKQHVGGLVVCSLVRAFFVVSIFLRLFMCLLVQHDSRWRHVSFWRDVHRLHVGDMS